MKFLNVFRRFYGVGAVGAGLLLGGVARAEDTAIAIPSIGIDLAGSITVALLGLGALYALIMGGRLAFAFAGRIVAWFGGKKSVG